MGWIVIEEVAGLAIAGGFEGIVVAEERHGGWQVL